MEESIDQKKTDEGKFDPQKQASLVTRTFAFFCCFLFLFWAGRSRVVSESSATTFGGDSTQTVAADDEQNETLVNVALLEKERDEGDSAKDILPKLVLLVDLNAATKAELTNLPGIGESLAERIIEYRESIGEYSEIEELLNVKGIGEKKLSALRPFCVVGKEKDKEL